MYVHCVHCGRIFHDSFLNRANYLAKRALFCAPGIAVDQDNNRVWPKSRCPGSSVWTSYFIVAETLEEKQVHLVKQVVGHFQGLVSKSASLVGEATPIHPVWILSLYKLFFNHQNAAVAKVKLFFTLRKYCKQIFFFSKFPVGFGALLDQ